MSPQLNDAVAFGDVVRRLALTLIPMILSLSVHEYAHAMSAFLLGDNTAKDQGRLTLNPQSHVDPWGTLLLPTLGVLSTSGLLGGGSLPFIGWARPVPYNPNGFREGVNRRVGAALVAVAGPLSNLALAMMAAGAMSACLKLNIPLGHVVARASEEGGARWEFSGAGVLLYRLFTLNVGLAIFNLIPIPPLDGHRLLPPVFDPIVRKLERFGFALLFLLLFVFHDVGDYLFGRPIFFVTQQIQALFNLR